VSVDRCVPFRAVAVVSTIGTLLAFALEGESAERMSRETNPTPVFLVELRLPPS